MSQVVLPQPIMVLRLAEQYLIRAEANIKLGNIQDAAADVDVIRHRAGLPNTIASTAPSLLAAIQRERRAEFFTEWGHRWLELKRSGTIDAIMNVATPLKGGTWKPTAQLYPIPMTDLQLTVNITQNPGYN